MHLPQLTGGREGTAKTFVIFTIYQPKERSIFQVNVQDTCPVKCPILYIAKDLILHMTRLFPLFGQ